MKFKVESSIASDVNNLVLAPKKLKTRPNDFINIKSSEVKVESEPIVETEKVEPIVETVQRPSFEDYSVKPEPEEDSNAAISVEDVIKERISDKPAPEPMDDNIEFAYAGRVVEPEVSDEEITRIKSLGDDYKGEAHTRVSATELKKNEPEYSENDYIALLKSECFLPKTKKYLDQRYAEFKNILEDIESTKGEIEEITDKYKMESEIASKLNSIKKETYSIMTWINNSDFKILKNEKTSAVNNLFKSYEELFNENQQKFKKADEELEKTNEISSELGRKEKEAREMLQSLIEKKKKTVKDYYKKIEEVIELDRNMKKQSSEMSAITGIDDIDQMGENKFDSLRSDE